MIRYFNINKSIMNNKNIPTTITIIQLVIWGFLYYTHKYKSGQIPADFIILNLFALCNIGVLFVAYFFYFRVENKQSIWFIPICLSLITILTLLISYLIMFFDKYK